MDMSPDVWHIDELMMGTRVGMTFQSIPDHQEDADGNGDAVELQRFVARHWVQVPLKLGSYAALVLLHAVVLGQLRGAGAKQRRWSGAVLGQVLVAGDGALVSPLCSMRWMNE